MAQLVGINHVALEVGDLEEALVWYGRFFEFELRGRAGAAMAFIDMGDQFIAMAAGRSQPPDEARHFGLVVDDKEGVRAGLQQAGVGVQAAAGSTSRSMGKSRAGRGLSRDPVHQDASRPARYGHRPTPENPPCARGAPRQGRHRLEPKLSILPGCRVPGDPTVLLLQQSGPVRSSPRTAVSLRLSPVLVWRPEVWELGEQVVVWPHPVLRHLPVREDGRHQIAHIVGERRGHCPGRQPGARGRIG